ncbi:MAG: hypothetical protein PHU21_13445 [Elusimicrobia bacterium]|jgi:hypothetical protein|nr:hypothetical protein [Elusimicrobiota bacterium]
MNKAAWPLLVLAALCACAGPAVYQNTSWGMNEKAFRAARPEAAAAGDRQWLEHATINGLKASVAYRMGARGLEDVTVVFDPAALPKDQYIDAYRQVKALLSEKYGAPEAQATDLVVRSQKYITTQAPDYQTPSLFRTPAALIRLTCEGLCDGTPGNGIRIAYGRPQAPGEGL